MNKSGFVEADAVTTVSALEMARGELCQTTQMWQPQVQYCKWHSYLVHRRGCVQSMRALDSLEPPPAGTELMSSSLSILAIRLLSQPATSAECMQHCLIIHAQRVSIVKQPASESGR